MANLQQLRSILAGTAPVSGIHAAARGISTAEAESLLGVPTGTLAGVHAAACVETAAWLRACG
ncbi:hypothetical protein [Corynebacterium sp. 212_CJEI]|uniref:hypothetical protein n=1 Tax=Corynebacterium sp. 212_CJEI TaxID=2715675 RepID=UPI0006694662|nr:hypothetical protein [Corynebacterium sp. 212_CJEI]